MIGFVLVLLIGELTLAACVGWLWHQYQQLTMPRALHHLHQATTATTNGIHSRRVQAEARVREFDGKEW